MYDRISWLFGPALTWLPNAVYFGRGFRIAERRIQRFNRLTPVELRQTIFRRVQSIVKYAYENNSFYRSFYEEKGFDPRTLRTWDDLDRIPIVTKSMLQEARFDDRCSSRRFRCRYGNTGGSTGQPLNFLLDPQAGGREWAHMLHAWSKLGYSRRDLKLTFRGFNLKDEAAVYSPWFNEIQVNSNAPASEVAAAADRLAGSRDIKFLHGYPSAIADFLETCESNQGSFLERLKREVRGVLLGSEFPAPIYRNKIERILDVRTLSWYGHGEKAVYAFEKDRFVYVPMHSYGYAECVQRPSGGTHLVGTSYDNWASPFIRYDTEDEVEPIGTEMPLGAFRITKGRSGEYVVDGAGKRVSLTALIHGRHHRLFEWARYIQVAQPAPGYCIVAVVPKTVRSTPQDVRRDFDDAGVGIEFEYRVIDRPVRSGSGKLPLLVEPSALEPDGMRTER